MTEEYQVIIQPEAEQSIKQAYYWVSRYSPRQARQWLEGLYAAIMSLKHMPLRCSFAFENNFFDTEIRQLLYGKGKNIYRILFAITGMTVQILYVRHAAQQPISPDDDDE